MQSEINTLDEKLSSLLEEFASTRIAIYKMIDEVEEISSHVKQLFPDTFDARYRLVFQERVKAVTELFKALLDMRKEITRNIKDEIELRRKVKSGDKLDDIENLLNMPDLISKIENMQEDIGKKATSTEEKIEKIYN